MSPGVLQVVLYHDQQTCQLSSSWKSAVVQEPDTLCEHMGQERNCCSVAK